MNPGVIDFTFGDVNPYTQMSGFKSMQESKSFKVMHIEVTNKHVSNPNNIIKDYVV